MPFKLLDTWCSPDELDLCDPQIWRESLTSLILTDVDVTASDI